MAFQTTTKIVMNEVAIARNGSNAADASYRWTPCSGGEGFNFWYYATSGGASEASVVIQVSLFKPGETAADGTTVFDLNSTDRNNYRSITLVADSVITLDEWVHVNTPAEMAYPFKFFRPLVTETNVAAITTFSLAVAYNGMR